MATKIVMPRLGDFMTEGTVASWAKKSGETVRQGEPIAEIESEKLTYELESAETAVLHTLVNEGEVVPVDGLLGYLLAEGEVPPVADAAVSQSAAATPVGTSASPTQRASGPAPRDSGAVVPSTPGARKLAANLGVDIAQVPAAGRRVMEDDVRAYAESLKSSAQSPTASGDGQKGGAPAIPAGLPLPARSTPLKGMRKGIAENMRASIANTAQLSFFLEVDVTDIQRMRRERSEGRDGVIALAHVLMKACAETMKKAPEINSVLAGGVAHYFDQVNIGVAVALDEGLIVPVVHSVESKDVYQVSAETQALAEKARAGALSHGDIRGATFTISVLGIVDSFTPILNSGQSAILGVGRTVEKPVVQKGQVVVREMTTLSLTVDHQVIDGAVAANFLRRLQQIIERPGPLFG